MTGKRYSRAVGKASLFATAGAAFIFVAPVAHAQYNASILGTVTDAQGAVIPDATVVLTNTETNQVITHKSSGAGVYTFNQLPPSVYTINATAKGFVGKTLDHVQVTPEQANNVNIELTVGSEAQSVTVSGDQASTLETATATISGTITAKQIQQLPSFGRDVFQLAQLAPGSFGDGAQAAGGGSASLPGSNISGSGGSDGIFKTENAPQVSGNGGQNQSNGISIDGISTVSAVWGGASVITPSEDSVKDVHVISNGYDASNGRFSAAQMQVVTKNGTNQVHGSLFFKADRPGLNAYQRYNGPVASGMSDTPAARGLQRNNNRFNQFGGTIGGPLWKDKIFAFFAYEGLRNNTSSTAAAWYEAPEFLALGAPGSIANQFLTYPGEGAASGTIIPQNCASIGLQENVQCRTLANGELNLGSPRTATANGTLDPTWVSSGEPGVGGGLTDTPTIAYLNTVNPTSIVEDQYNGRLDVQPTHNDLFTFTIYWVPTSTTNYNGPVRAANLWHHTPINDAFAGIWDHTFSPTLLNEARANAAGWRWNEIATNPQAPLGLPTAKIDSLGSMTSTNTITGQYFGAPGPSDFNQWTYSYEDTLTKILSRHQLKMGGGVTRLYYLNNPTYSARPNYGFRNPWDFLNDAPYTESGSFSPLTGTPTTNRQDIRSDIYSGFIQDDFKVRPNLTINAGLRWTYFGPISSKEGNLAVLQQGAGAAALTGASLKTNTNLYNAQKLNFGPQIGFAWSPDAQQGKLVFRGGFGLNYNQEMIAIAGNGASNPPFITNANFCCSTAQAINPDIAYSTAGDVHSLFGYPSNPSTISTFNAANIPITGGPIAVVGYPSTLPTAYVYHYSLDMQYQVAKNMVATVGYQSSLGRHMIRQYNENVTAAVAGIPLNPRLQNVTIYGNDSRSTYHALVTSLKHNFSQDFQAEAQYTWSKSMDTGSQSYYEDPYPYNPALAYGRSDYNVAHAFKVFGVYSPVFFRGNRNGLAEKLIGGWSISGILNIHSGFPWTPLYTNTGGNVYYQGAGYSSLRPGSVRGGYGHDTSNKAFISGPNTPSGASNYNSNFDRGALAYFTVPTFTQGPNFGDGTNGVSIPQGPGVERNTLNGPNYIDADMTLSKSFGIPKNKVLGESGAVEVRANAYNIYNRLNLNDASIDTSISNDGVTSNPSFGQAKSALGARTIEMQARFSF